MLRSFAWPAALLLLGAAACEDPTDDDDTPAPTPSGEGLEYGDEVVCAAPTAGFDRLVENAVARGLDVQRPELQQEGPCILIEGGIVVHDLDADGDPDVLVPRKEGDPLLFENDGATLQAVPLELGRPASMQGALASTLNVADVDGDGLPELYATLGPNTVVTADNLGDLRFGDWRSLVELTGPLRCVESMAWGDLDADGDLDLVLPGLDPVADPQVEWAPIFPTNGSADRVLLQDAGEFTLHQELTSAQGEMLSLLAVITDRDLDGDADILFGTDRAVQHDLPPLAFHRNDGGLQFVDDAGPLGMEAKESPMGAAVVDLNDDGVPDYLYSDDRIWAWVSDGLGGWAESSLVYGLLTEWSGHPADDVPDEDAWVGWSLEHDDLDNDGWADIVAAGGAPPPIDEHYGDLRFPHADMPDQIWRGSRNGFENMSEDLGWWDAAPHFGLATADLWGDGSLDVLVGAAGGPVQLFDNPCTEGAWIDVDLVGPPGNREGYGAWIEVFVGDRAWRRQMLPVRVVGQGPSSFHVGLGDARVIDRMRLRWPDGTISEATGIPTRRKAVWTHPDAL